VKVLICCESEIVLHLAAMSLEAAGHQVGASASRTRSSPWRAAPRRCSWTRRARSRRLRLLRDRGFRGRALLVGDGTAGAGPEGGGAEARWRGPIVPARRAPRRFTAALEARKRVLIVDDSEIVARLLKEELEAKGFEIQYAPDAEKATSIILKRQTRPDLILLDINMPKVDGAQFCRFLKKNEMFRSIKVVFCSARTSRRSRSSSPSAAPTVTPSRMSPGEVDRRQRGLKLGLALLEASRRRASN
jgi:CheY-like chemotaxis protein